MISLLSKCSFNSIQQIGDCLLVGLAIPESSYGHRVPQAFYSSVSEDEININIAFCIRHEISFF